MKLQHFLLVCVGLVCLFSGFCMPGVGIDAKAVGDDYEGCVADTAIRDTIWMKGDTIVTCILQPRVLLTCSDEYKHEDILEYKWIDLSTNKKIGDTRNIWVETKSTKEYALEIQLLDRKRELIANPDFERGNTGFMTAYRYMRPGYNVLWDEGTYTVSTNPRGSHTNFDIVGDHTTGRGQMMIINGNKGKNVKVWGQTISGLNPGQQYAFSAWAIQVTDGAQPILQYTINGLPLSTSESDNCKPPRYTWVRFHKYWTAGATTANISLVDQCTVGGGNDFAIDDISFAPISLITGKVLVKVRPQISLDALKDIEVCEGADVDIQSNATGSEIDAYKWVRLSDKNVVSETNSFVLRNASLAKDQGHYLCIVKGVCGVDSAFFTVDVREKLRMNGLETDTVEVCYRNPALLTAERCTGYNLSYSWRAPGWNWLFPGKNWLPVTADTKEYKKSSVDNSDAGKYRCIVLSTTNKGEVCGNDTIYSVLKVKGSPVLIAQSPDTTICAGGDLRLYVKTDDKDALTTWFLPDGSTVIGEDVVVRGGDVPSLYKYEVSNGCVPLVGSVWVGIVEPLGNLSVNADTTVCRGEAITLVGKVSGESLKYDWTGPDSFNAATADVTLTDITDAQEGVYRLVVTDFCGNVRKDSVKISINRNYDNLRINENKKYCKGAVSDTLEVKGGIGKIKYTWVCPDGTIVRTKKLVIPAVTDATTGVYVCKVEGECGVVEKSTLVSVIDGLVVTGNTGKHRLCEGDNIHLLANSNLPILSREWRKDGILLGETNADLTIASMSPQNVGKYSCTLVAECERKVLEYELELKETTRIIDYTPDAYLDEYSSILLFANAKGENNTYKWTRDGVPVGTSGNKLYTNNIGKSGIYTFVCKAKGECGEDECTIKVYVGKYNTLTADRAVRLCEKGDYSYNAALLPEGCSVGSPLSYRWEYGGKTIKTTSLLEFKQLKSSAGGRYICYITGSCGQAVLNLDVMVLGIPKLSQLPDTLSVCEEAPATLIAKGNSNDILTYTWQKGGITMGGTDSVFQINRTKLTDAGKYSCRVSGQCGEDLGEFVLDVRKKLEIQESKDTIEVCHGEALVLRVDAVGDRLEYVWNGPNQSGWSGGNTANYGNGGVDRGKDAGKYRCIVSSSCGRDTVYTVLKLEQEIKLLAQTPDMVVCPESAANLYARINFKGVKYTWTLPNGVVSSSEELVVNKVMKTDTGTYRFRIKGKCSEVNGRITLGLQPALGELSLSPDTAVCEHGKAAFYAFAKGVDVKYQWRGPGHYSAETPSITISDVVTALAGKYNVVATDVCNRQKLGSVGLSILDEFEGIKAVGDTVLCLGAEFVAEVKGGSGQLVYEWKFKDQVVGRNPRFSIPAIASSDTGVYVCRVVGTCESKNYPVKVGAHKQLEIEEPIRLVNVCPGVDTSFLFKANGEDVTYLWTRKGLEVGTRSDVLPFYEVSVLDTGRYICKVTSACGEEEREFNLQMKPRTVIRSHTPDRFVTENDPALLTVRAEGENNTYQWWRDGVFVGTENSILHIPDVGKADTLNFICAVQGDCGVDTAYIKIKIGVYKSIQEVVSPDTLCEGSTYTYVADYVPDHCYGDESFTYTWSFNGNKIGEGPLLRLEDIKMAQGGEYSCFIKGDCDQATIIWKVHVMALPVIERITANSFVIEGANHEIEVKATGEDLAYSWTKDRAYYLKNKTKISFQPVKYENQGTYRVTVKNGCASVSAQSELKVWQKTTIITPLVENATMCHGEDSVFRVEALGASGLLYKWYHNGDILSCPMVPELRLEDVSAKDAGEYMCVVSGKGGNDSCIMNLTIKELPKVGIDGDTQICVNDLNQVYTAREDEQGLVYIWQAVGGAVQASNRFNKVEVLWQVGEEDKIMLKATSSKTGCTALVEKDIKYDKLPEVYLDLPEMVGYCLDSLALNQGYPWGGEYRVDHILASAVVFDYKEKDYEVVYTYMESATGCVNSENKSIGVDKQPVIVLKEEQVETGLCRPVVLGVREASVGDILWTGENALDTTDVLNPIYTPKVEDGEGVYFSVELTDKYGCSASDYVNVSIVDLPVVKAMDDVKAGVCGETVLTAEYTTSRFAGLEWLPAEELNKGDNYSAIVKAKIAGQHLYEAVVTDVYGCEGRDSVILTVMPSPPMDDEAFCEDKPMRVHCRDFLNYVWSDGYLDSVRVLDKKGDYSLVVTDEFGCVGTVHYSVHPMPVVDIRDTVLYEGQTSTFVVHPEEYYQPYDIIWQDNSSGYSYFVDKEGHYEVVVADNIGCTSKDTAYVEVKKRYIAAPDAFLPNSSGENARFYLKEVNFGSTFEMFIYDRWGELLFKTSEIGFNGGWDGTFKNMHCQPGAYVWVAFVDGKQVGRGTLMLVK